MLVAPVTAQDGRVQDSAVLRTEGGYVVDRLMTSRFPLLYACHHRQYLLLSIHPAASSIKLPMNIQRLSQFLRLNVTVSFD